MVAHIFASGTTEPDPTDHDLETAPTSHSRVAQTAHAITQRVRRALAPDGFTPLRVLVVDDHPDAAESLAIVLELLGCPVRACHNGQEALAAVQEFQPQVCLIDLVMPGMNGLELASRLKAWAAGRPLLVVATTALGDAETRARTAEAGFHEHLVKPVDAPTLIDALARLRDALARVDRDAPWPDGPTQTPSDGEEGCAHS